MSVELSSAAAPAANQPPPEFVAEVPSGWVLAMAAFTSLCFMTCGGVSLALSLGNGKAENNPIQTAMPVVTFMLSMGLFYAVIQLMRPHRAIVTESGLQLFSRIGRQTIPWADIRSAEVKKEFGGAFAQLSSTPGQAGGGGVYQLKNAKGRTLAELPTNFSSFGILQSEIDRRSRAARGDSAGPLVVPPRNARRSTLIAGLFLLLMGVLTIGLGASELLSERGLRDNPGTAQAEIVRLYQFNGYPRIEYRLVVPGHEIAVRNTGITADAQAGLQGQTTVPVIYDRADPSVSRLVLGESQEKGTGTAWFMIVGGILELLLGAGALIMLALGFTDIRMVDGRLRLVRAGQSDPVGEAVDAATAGLPPPIPALHTLPPDSERPTGLFVFGGLSIAFGGMGALWSAFLALLALATLMHFGSFYDALNPPPMWAQVWQMASTLLSVALNIALVVAGIGILWLRPWARSLGLGVVSIKLLVGVAAIIVGVVMLPMGETNGAFEAAERRREIMGHMLGCFGNMGSMVFPALLAWVLASPMARGAFAAPQNPAR